VAYGERTPLWPAGHLPHKGGDWLNGGPLTFRWRRKGIGKRGAPLSPLVGEMSAKLTEGGTPTRQPETA